MENFTPASAIFGGTLIGLAAALLLIANGRIAGISGIAFGTFTANQGDRAWRWYFLVGLFAGAGAYLAYFGLPFEMPHRSLPQLIIAGFLVGVGTRLGNGCTSGHGVCGIGRFSTRSLVATAVFLTTAVATVWLTTQLTGA